jgi:hypothetical protein
MKRHLLIAMLTGCCFSASSQQPFSIDSLRKLLGKHDTAEIMTLRRIAYTFYNNGNDSCLYYNQKALELAKKLGAINQELEITNGRVELLRNSGNYPQALQLALDYLKRAESLKDTTHIFWSTRSIMMTYEFMPSGTFRIMEYANRLKDLVHSGFFKDPQQKERFELIGYVNHALVYYKSTGQKDSVLYLSQRSYEMAMHLKDDQGLALAAGNMASINLQLGNEDLAISYYKNGVEAALRAQRYDLAAGFEMALAELYQEKGLNDSVTRYTGLSLATLDKVREPTTRLDVYAALSGIFKNNRQLDSAYKYLSLSVAMKDSIYSQQKINTVETMMVNEQLRQLELQKEKQEQIKERKLNLQFLALALGLIAFMIVFLIFSYSIIANERLIRFLGVVALLVLFEFINLFIHPYLATITNHSPFLMLAIMVLIAALLVPAHHSLQKWISNKLVEKNKKIRLAAAKRTIAKLEGETEIIQK